MPPHRDSNTVSTCDRPLRLVLLGNVLVMFLLTALTAVAQQQQPTVPASSKDRSNAENGTSNDRLFYTLPNFLTVQNAGQLPPLTPAQKFKVVTRGSFDYVEYPWYGALAGISQAENSEPSFGQGAAG